MACEAPEWDYDPRLFLSDSSQMASKAKRPPEVSSIEPGDPGTWPLATMQSWQRVPDWPSRSRSTCSRYPAAQWSSAENRSLEERKD